MVTDRILMRVWVSEADQRANSGMSIDAYWKMAENCVQQARNEGITVCGAINSIWGCPKAGPMDMDKAVTFAARWLEISAHDIEHADHDGSATPDKVYNYFARVLDAIPEPEKHITHFHATRGWGLTSVLAALQAGITQYEGTMGRLGRQPANFVDGVPVAGTGDYYHTGRVCYLAKPVPTLKKITEPWKRITE